MLPRHRFAFTDESRCIDPHIMAAYFFVVKHLGESSDKIQSRSLAAISK